MSSRRHPHAPARHRLGLTALALAGLLVSGCSIASVRSPLSELVPLPEASAPAPQPSESSRSTTGSRPRTERSATRGKAARPFTLDLYDRNDHVAQYDDSWCVGASMQMMINMIEPGRPDRTRQMQQRLYKYARKVSPWVETRPGASVYGWSEGLELLGYGPYEELASDSRQGALKLAARQMRLTDKPVGLLVWAGAHAWVMSGFKATADPALTDDFTVTHVWIEDPWSGRTSRVWGPGLAPHTLLTVGQLASDYVRYESFYRPQYGRKGRFVIVAPLEETAALAG